MVGMTVEFDAEITEVVENEKRALRSTGGNIKGSWLVALCPANPERKLI